MKSEEEILDECAKKYGYEKFADAWWDIDDYHKIEAIIMDAMKVITQQTK